MKLRIRVWLQKFNPKLNGKCNLFDHEVNLQDFIWKWKDDILRLQTLSLTLLSRLKWPLDLFEIMTKSRVDTMMFWEFLGDNNENAQFIQEIR